MENAISFIKAISTVLWPITTLIIVFTFKKSISKLVSRLHKGKILGNEFEFSQEAKKLEKSVNKAKNEIPYFFSITNDDTYKKILEDSSNNPAIGILLVSAELEKKIKQIFALTGLSNSTTYKTITQSFDILVKRRYLTKNVLDSVKMFLEIRNKISHGRQIENSNNIINILDTGLGLLKLIDSIPHEKNYVYKHDIVIYKDTNCTIPYEKGKAIILDTHSPNDASQSKRIFPTTKTGFKVGTQLTWEWSFNNQWDETYYIDPDTKEKKCAWSSSAEFVGRDIQEV